MHAFLPGHSSSDQAQLSVCFGTFAVSDNKLDCTKVRILQATEVTQPMSTPQRHSSRVIFEAGSIRRVSRSGELLGVQHCEDSQALRIQATQASHCGYIARLT